MVTALARVVATAWRDVYLNAFVASPVVPRQLRWILLRAYGLRIRRSAISAGGFYGGRNIQIDAGCFLNYGVFLDSAAPVTIGCDTQIGPNVTVITGSHELGPSRRRAGADKAAPVVIGRGVWIGAAATVMPGVTIGDGAVIGAAAVVVKDVAADTVQAGVPARWVRDLDRDEPVSRDASAR